MALWRSSDMIIGNQGIEKFETSALHSLGSVFRATDSASTAYGTGQFIYLKGVASTVVGSACLFAPDDYTTTLLVPNDIGFVAFAMSINILATTYGWYQVTGKGVAKVAAAFADNANCYSTITAGVIDDAIVAGDRIKNCKGASAIDTPSTGLAEIEMWWPFVDDALAA